MERPVYDTIDCMTLIHKKYKWIPIFVIRRVLYAEELYMRSVGIIDFDPSLDYWLYEK